MDRNCNKTGKQKRRGRNTRETRGGNKSTKVCKRLEVEFSTGIRVVRVKIKHPTQW
jgi:hypothetical protein